MGEDATFMRLGDELTATNNFVKSKQGWQTLMRSIERHERNDGKPSKAKISRRVCARPHSSATVRGLRARPRRNV